LTSYLTTPIVAQLDTALAFPGRSEPLRRVTIDTGVGTGPRIRIAHWAPLAPPTGVYVFWGDGFTGLDMRLSIHGDTLRGPSTRTSDDGLARKGPVVLAVRLACP
jgi:hypothetical protein